MKWNLIALVALLAAPALSMGASIALQVGGTADTTIEVLPGGSFTVDIVIDMGANGAAGLDGFDGQLRSSAQDGALTWDPDSTVWNGVGTTSATRRGPKNDTSKFLMSTATVSPVLIPVAGTSTVGAAGTDVAVGVLAGAKAPYKAADLPGGWIEQITILVDPAAANYPYTLSLEGAYIQWAAGAGGNAEDITPLTKITITPEPASLVLLALGGLFLRRRHA